jgi:TonB family protein
MLEDGGHESDSLTVRLPRRMVRLMVAGLAALLVHGACVWAVSLLPEPKRVEKHIEVTLVQPPPRASSPKPAKSAAPASPKKVARHTPEPAAPRTTSPVLPVLPPSEVVPPDRVQLPVAEKSDAPAPPPKPMSWKESLLAQLAATSPPAPRMPTGMLAPSFSALDHVAAADPRLHDDEAEARLAQDFGPFFRRGLEQLRANWHPDDVLDRQKERRERNCGHVNRTTMAVAVLDHDGNVTDVELKNPSGCEDLDDEAIAAFKRIAKFPHPPSGIFTDPDGTTRATARFPVHFIVTFDGSGPKLFWQ